MVQQRCRSDSGSLMGSARVLLAAALLVLACSAAPAKADAGPQLYNSFAECASRMENAICFHPDVEDKCLEKATCKYEQYDAQYKGVKLLKCTPGLAKCVYNQDPCQDVKCEKGDCKHYPKVDGFACEKDNNKCTVDKCLKGKCEKHEDLNCKVEGYDKQCIKKEGYCDPIKGCVEADFYEDGFECDTDDNKCTVEECKKGKCVKRAALKCADLEAYGYDAACVKHEARCDPKKGCAPPELYVDGYECDIDFDVCTVERCYKGKCQRSEKLECKFDEYHYDDQCVKKEGFCDPFQGCVAPEYFEDGYECDTDYNKCTVEKCYMGKCQKQEDLKCKVDYDKQCVKEDGYCDPKYGCVDAEYYPDGYECDTDYSKCTLEKCYKGKCVKKEDLKCQFDDYSYDKQCIKEEGYCDPKKGCVGLEYFEDGYNCDTDYNDKCLVKKCYKGKCEKYDVKCQFDDYSYDKQCIKKEGYCDPKKGCVAPEYYEDGYNCDTDYDDKCVVKKCNKGKCVKHDNLKCKFEDYNYDKECVKKEGYCDPYKGCIAPEYYEDGYECDKDYDKCTIEECYKGKCVKHDDLKCKFDAYGYDKECVKKAGYCDPKYGCVKAEYYEDGYECDKDYDKCTVEMCYKGKCVKQDEQKCKFDDYSYDNQCVKREGYCDPKKGCVRPEYFEDGYECDNDYNKCTVEGCKKGKCEKVADLVCPYHTDYHYDKECVKKEGYCDPKMGCVKPEYFEDGYECDNDYNKCTVEKCYYGKCEKVDKLKCDGRDSHDGQCVMRWGYCDPHMGCVEPKFRRKGHDCDTDGKKCTKEECDGYGKCKLEKDKCKKDKKDEKDKKYDD